MDKGAEDGRNEGKKKSCMGGKVKREVMSRKSQVVGMAWELGKEADGELNNGRSTCVGRGF